MGKVKDMSGEKYNHLTVLRFSEIKNNNSHWICKCNLCGNETEVSRPNLRSGNTKDCGCRKSEKIKEAVSTHKQSKTPTWNTWSKMRSRIKMGSKHSSIYGKIDIDPRWNDFEVFLKDMGERPNGKTLDRIDNTKGYLKENCRWATQAEQNRNRTTNVMLTFRGKTMCAADWAKEIGIHRDTIRRRLKRGLSVEEVLIKLSGRI
jgi:hypothetical protein